MNIFVDSDSGACVIASVRKLKDELAYLQEPSSYVGEVVKLMGKTKVLVKVGQDGKYICKIDKNIDINKLVAGTRVALRSDSYALYKILPTKVISFYCVAVGILF